MRRSGGQQIADEAVVDLAWILQLRGGAAVNVSVVSRYGDGGTRRRLGVGK